MAARDYSKHQQGIIKRYYDNRESIDGEKLSEAGDESLPVRR